ncbi:D-2-hydroxyacid dehydrogenase [Microvirga lotononidis]|uniref:Phosphoglycerate dehydrogenase-like oxidoreductase n=1 Tax=Microvirga lotononidis TaxID=864069 RepID=I4YUE8_9HYPH|nr:D-2-hydroxyacid dehydrogenase [Microvirga lotononidis]EIM27590.1 phosphoglycerate dehydrogenase-like oxidoreductase [Microvirga lotononidis]WQO28264.1 D-2-hydroxyacid dehydrogenase [Microvirga lotononidis]
MHSNLRIHIENDPATPSLMLDEQALRQRLNAIPGLSVAISVNSTGRSESIGHNADILLACRKLNIDEAKAANPNLRFVQTISAGVEAYLDHLPADVSLANASGVHAAKGAEFILCAALMLNFSIPHFVTDKEHCVWAPKFGGTIAERKVLMLGVGSIGSAAARALRSQGAYVIGITRSGAPHNDLNESYPIERLDQVLDQADLVVCTLPLTPGTRNLMNAERLARLKPGCGIVNVGRAGVIDYQALEDRLRSGDLSGAVLDVFPEEPLPVAHSLWDCPRLVITPHCSLDDHTTYMNACLDIFAENVGRFARGEDLINEIDRHAGY